MKGRHIRVLVNPSSHSGRAWRSLRRAGLLDKHPPGISSGVFVEWVESKSAAHFCELVQQAQGDNLDALGLAGGDGTVALAVAAISALAKPNPVPFGILPVGSGNDFAKHLGVPASLGGALDLLVHGVPRRVDIARVQNGERYCCVASVGIDEMALPIIHSSRLPRSKLLNIYATIRSIVSYKPRHIRMIWQGGMWEGDAIFAAVTNTRSYGGGFCVSPAAHIDDGILDICIIARANPLRLLGTLTHVLRGSHSSLEGVIVAQSPWVKIEGDGVPVSLDGELPSVHTPVELRCEPAAINVLSPPTQVAGTARIAS